MIHLLKLLDKMYKYEMDPTRTVDATERTRDAGRTDGHPLMIVIICVEYKKNPSRTVDATERTRFSKSRPNDLKDIGQGQRSLCATHPRSDHLWLIWKESIQNCRCYRADTAGGTDGRTDGQTDGVKPIYPPTTSLLYNNISENVVNQWVTWPLNSRCPLLWSKNK